MPFGGEAGHDGCACCDTHGARGISLSKIDTSGREVVQVRCFYNRMTIPSQAIPAPLIGEDE